jgi:hypothetical protein
MRPQGLGLEVVNNGSQNLQRQIEATGRQIDALLYELHELTEGDIGIFEEDQIQLKVIFDLGKMGVRDMHKAGETNN